MKRTSIVGGCLVAATSALLLVGSVLAGIETNGSFENGTDPGAGFSTEFAGSTDITGWTIVSGNVDYIETYWQASEGTRSIDLNGGTAGAISQAFTTQIGATYTITFALSGNPDNPASDSDKAVKVSVNAAAGSTSETFVFDTSVADNSQTDMKWRDELFSFVATSSTTTLTFASQTPGAWGPALDNVAITETLPTAADCKDGGWDSMIDGSGVAFKNQGDCVSFFATDGKNTAAGTAAP